MHLRENFVDAIDVTNTAVSANVSLARQPGYLELSCPAHLASCLSACVQNVEASDLSRDCELKTNHGNHLPRESIQDTSTWSRFKETHRRPEYGECHSFV